MCGVACFVVLGGFVVGFFLLGKFDLNHMLDRRSDLPYREVHHLRGREDEFRHSLVFQNLYHRGDTKSAQELGVFLRMARERLRLCCGIQCTDSLHPNGPRERQKLFTAALKLLWFAIGIETVKCYSSS